MILRHVQRMFNAYPAGIVPTFIWPSRSKNMIFLDREGRCPDATLADFQWFKKPRSECSTVVSGHQ